MTKGIKAQMILQDAVIKIADVQEALLYVTDLLEHSGRGFGLAYILRGMAADLSDAFGDIIPMNEENMKTLIEEGEGNDSAE